MAITKTIIIDAQSKQAQAEVKAIDSQLKNIDKDADKGSKGVKKVSLSFKALGIAMKAAGIGLIIGALAKLSEVFFQNQKVLDAFNIAMEGLSIVFNDFTNFVINNGGAVVDFFKAIFENPLKSVKALGASIKANIVERFESFLDTLGFLASAVKKVFSGDFKGALEDVKAAGKESIDVLTGVNNTVDKTSEFVTKTATAVKNYAKETFNTAKANIALNTQAEKGIALNRLLIEQYDRQSELQRQIRDDETKTIDERIKANQRLGELLAEQEKLMLANADAQVKAAQAQFNKLKNDETEIALLEAKAEREGVLAQITGLKSEQLINTNSLERERLDLLTEADEKAKESLENEAILQKAKQDMAKQTLGNISEALGKNSKEGKAFAAAQALINTYQGITAELATKTATPFEFGLKLANIAATASIGFKSVKDILKTSPSSSGGGASSPATGSQPPSFNIVGASETNQLADAIGGQAQEPVQAYVVSNDVTTAQSLQNNIVEGATIGG